MLRTVDIPLMAFCARQRNAFHAQDWLESPLPSQVLGTAALLLAYTPWYGHRDELMSVGHQLNPSAKHDLVGQMRLVQLYPARFVQMVQKQVKLL